MKLQLFYTPHDVVELIASFIQPFDGTIYDPCCGSGGMFIQSAQIVEAKQGDISKINVYGQEYGSYLIQRLSKELEPEYGSGFGKRQLEMSRQFYREYPIANTLYSQLNWYQYKFAYDHSRCRQARVLPT